MDNYPDEELDRNQDNFQGQGVDMEFAGSNMDNLEDADQFS